MSTHGPSPEASFADPQVPPADLALNFDADPESARALIRDELDTHRDRFYASALETFKAGAGSPRAQYLVELMLANGMLVAALCDPGLTLDQAIEVGKSALRVDPAADAALARTLADNTLGTGDPVRDPARLMEILSRIADAARILPSLMRLLRHQSPHMRSKVVKMIGRGSRSVKWVRAKLSEADARVRANAVEALWGLDTPEARALLHFATKDVHNRVLGNALVGLYYLGDSSALEEIVKMSAHESALFRATAAWAMGETGDVRFSDIVRRLLLQPEPLVRKRALVALGRIKQASVAAGEPELYISGSMAAGSKTAGLRRVMAAVASSDTADLKRIAPIHFILCEGGRYVTSYKVNERPVADAIKVIFVIPAAADPGVQPLIESALSCLKWKRPADRWAVLPYNENGDSPLVGELPERQPPKFTASAEEAAHWFHEAQSLDCADLWSVLLRATRTAGLPSHGKRYVIVLSRTPESKAAGRDLLTAAESASGGLQVISSVDNPHLAAFCRGARSPYRQVSATEAPEAIRQVYLSHLARYDITYQSVSAQGAPLKLRVQSPDGWAETMVAIPPPE